VTTLPCKKIILCEIQEIENRLINQSENLLKKAVALLTMMKRKIVKGKELVSYCYFKSVVCVGTTVFNVFNDAAI
jgi:hypothetical protein